MYFTDSSQHIVYTDRRLSLVFTYDSMLGLHSVWNARKAEEKVFHFLLTFSGVLRKVDSRLTHVSVLLANPLEHRR